MVVLNCKIKPSLQTKPYLGKYISTQNAIVVTKIVSRIIAVRHPRP